MVHITLHIWILPTLAASSAPYHSSHFPLAQGLPCALAPYSFWAQCLNPDSLPHPEFFLFYFLSDALANSY